MWVHITDVVFFETSGNQTLIDEMTCTIVFTSHKQKSVTNFGSSKLLQLIKMRRK